MIPDPKVVLALARDIEEAEANLTALKDKWANLFYQGAAPVADKATTPNKRDHAFTSRVLNLLTSNSGVLYGIADVAEELGADQLKTGRTLFRLYERKKIDNPSRGIYCAKVQLEVEAA